MAYRPTDRQVCSLAQVGMSLLLASLLLLSLIALSSSTGPPVGHAQTVPPLDVSTKAVTPAIAAPGTSLSYTILLRNIGDAPLPAAHLTDTLPLSLTYTGDLGASAGSYGFSSGVITWSGAISPASAVTITFSAWLTTAAADGVTIANHALITGDGRLITRTAVFTVDAAPPTCTITAPTPGQYLSGLSFTIQGTATDNVAGVSRVYVGLDGQTIETLRVSETLGVFTTTWTLPADEDGVAHTVRAVAVDGVGHRSPTATVSVRVDNVPPRSPDVFYSTSHLPGGWSEDPVIDVVWGGASDGSGIAGYVLAWSQNPTDTITGELQSNTWGDSRPRPDGPWYAHLRTQDLAGHWSTDTLHLGPFLIDTLPPTSTLTPPGTAFIPPGHTITLRGTATDNHVGLQQVEIGIAPGEWYADTDNLLRNPGFEFGAHARIDPYAPDQGPQPPLIVADGWELWYDGVPGRDGYNHRPEYQYFDHDAHPTLGRVRSGRYAQKMCNTYATHTAGFYQRVPVPRGSQVTFSIWVKVWSSSYDDLSQSTDPGYYRTYVGIDPTGGTDWRSPHIIWSEPLVEYDTWNQMIVTATAQADAVTVFTKGQPEWRVKHNDSFWDDARLVIGPPRPTNEGFDGSYSHRPDPYNPGGPPEPELYLADGWELWYDNDQSEGPVYNHRPEYTRQSRDDHPELGRTLSGPAAQKMFTVFSTHTAGAYQRVPVPPGSEVRFSIWVKVWSSNQDQYLDQSIDPGNYRVSVGIDPTGGTDWRSGDIIWSEPVIHYDEWIQLSVAAIAQADHVTVYTRGAPEWPVKHNDSYWDQARIEIGPRYPANSGFDGAFPKRVDPLHPEEGEVNEWQVAESWQPWYIPGTEPLYGVRPEYFPVYVGDCPPCNWVRSGNSAQMIRSHHSTHTGGLYQQVQVPPGSEVTFSIWRHIWSSSYDTKGESTDPGKVYTWIGIDPTGGTDPSSSDIVWTRLDERYDAWWQLVVTATAQGPTVTLFTKQSQEWPVKNNYVFWDDARLLVRPVPEWYSVIGYTGQSSSLPAYQSSNLPATEQSFSSPPVTWAYTWTAPITPGTYSIHTRATDWLGHRQEGGAGYNIQVIPRPWLAPSYKRAGRSWTPPGTALTYTIVLSNIAPYSGSVSLLDPLPPGTAYITASARGGLAYSPTLPTGPGLTWQGPISAHTALTFTFAVSVGDILPSPLWGEGMGVRGGTIGPLPLYNTVVITDGYQTITRTACTPVSWRAPVSFTLPLTTVHVGQVVTFSDHSLVFPLPTEYAWDFGDGTLLLTSTVPFSPTHTYTHPGVYTVTLTARNDCCTLSAQMPLRVVGFVYLPVILKNEK